MLDVSRSDLTAGVAGSGTMGRGTAVVPARCGAARASMTRGVVQRKKR